MVCNVTILLNHANPHVHMPPQYVDLSSLKPVAEHATPLPIPSKFQRNRPLHGTIGLGVNVHVRSLHK
jgi:hypothetical protein